MSLDVVCELVDVHELRCLVHVHELRCLCELVVKW